MSACGGRRWDSTPPCGEMTYRAKSGCVTSTRLWPLFLGPISDGRGRGEGGGEGGVREWLHEPGKPQTKKRRTQITAHLKVENTLVQTTRFL